MKRSALVVLTLGALVATLGSASQDPEAVHDALPLYATPTTLDRIGRVVAPVMLNGKGPFRLVVDTGANRSTISTRLAKELGLESGTQQLTLNGVTGSAVVPAVNIGHIQAGDLIILNERVPVIGSHIMGGADGILGVAGLRDERVLIDFKDDQVSISRSNRGLTSEFVTIKAKRLPGGLLVAAARMGRARLKVIIDTGAEYTLGNLALKRELDARRRRGPEGVATEVYGATPDIDIGHRVLAPDIVIGDATLKDVRVTFGDFHIFDVWKLENEPVLLIGMDVIGTVDTIVIDFRRAEIHIRG